MKLTAEQLEQLAVDLKSESVTKEESKRLAQEYGLHIKTIRNYSRKLKTGVKVRTKLKPLSLTKEDLIATIRHYLP